VNQGQLGRTTRFIRSAMIMGAVLSLGMLFLATPAYAAVGCTFGAGTAAVTMSASETATVKVVSGQIQVNGTQCGIATTSNTTDISVTGDASNNQIAVIDLSGGSFGTINWTVDLVSGTGDTLTITGASTADNIRFGTLGIDLDAGGSNLDVTSPSNVDAFIVNAGAGDDIVSAAGGGATGSEFASAVTFNGGDGADTLTGGSAGDTLNGDAGNDVIAGSGGADTESGGDGNDTFNEGSASNGGDTFNGDVGEDKVDYSGRSAVLTVTIGAGASNDGQASEGDDVTSTVEDVTGGSGADSITGSTGNNVIDGGPGTANDTLVGGTGTDTLSYQSVSAGVTVNLATTTAQNTVGAGTDTQSGFENLTGGSGNDTLTGGERFLERRSGYRHGVVRGGGHSRHG
jgi:Ca2+-binding RTX toxin-like protein